MVKMKKISMLVARLPNDLAPKAGDHVARKNVAYLVVKNNGLEIKNYDGYRVFDCDVVPVENS